MVVMRFVFFAVGLPMAYRPVMNLNRVLMTSSFSMVKITRVMINNTAFCNRPIQPLFRWTIPILLHSLSKGNMTMGKCQA